MSVVIQTTETVKCRHCNSEAIVKFGTYKGVQRYYCKTCKRKFKHDDKQFNMKSETEQVATALHDYYDGGSSVREIGRHILQETGKTPSTATIYEWIQKYTQYLTDSIKDYHPKVGDVWVADETVVKVGGQQFWLWDLIDSDTRYLLSSRLSTSRTTRDAQMLMDKAMKRAGKSARVVLTDKLASYLDVDYGKDTEHRQGSPFTSSEDCTNLIERWHGTVKARTKVMRGLKNIETAHEFVDGFLAYYNYLRPHESLGNKPPAEEAGITYPYKNWDDLIRSHKPTHKVIIEHQPRGRVKLPPIQIGRPLKHVRTPKPKASKLSSQVLVQKTHSGTTLLSRKRVRGTRLVGRYGGKR